MGYDMVHLGWRHGQVTLWGGLGRDLRPGDPVTLTPAVRTATGLADRYDVDLDGTSVQVRGGIISGGQVRPGTPDDTTATLTAWGQPWTPAAAGPSQDERRAADIDAVAVMFSAFAVEQDPARAYDDASALEAPARCPVCAEVRQAGTGKLPRLNSP
jgi:hypothetical protein